MNRLDRKPETKTTEWIEFSCLKASEGGMSKQDTLKLLRDAGINCKGDGYSPYVGHYGILVDKKHEDKAAKLLWG